MGLDRAGMLRFADIESRGGQPVARERGYANVDQSMSLLRRQMPAARATAALSGTLAAAKSTIGTEEHRGSPAERRFHLSAGMCPSCEAPIDAATGECRCSS